MLELYLVVCILNGVLLIAVILYIIWIFFYSSSQRRKLRKEFRLQVLSQIMTQNHVRQQYPEPDSIDTPPEYSFVGLKH
jgi:hypothetical protein